MASKKTDPQAIVAAIVVEAMDHPDVAAAIANKARRVLTRAQYEAYKAGRINFGDQLRIQTGTRPGAKSPTGLRRPYARITSTITTEQHEADNRTAKVSRTNILRRSAR